MTVEEAVITHPVTAY